MSIPPLPLLPPQQPLLRVAREACRALPLLLVLLTAGCPVDLVHQEQLELPAGQAVLVPLGSVPPCPAWGLCQVALRQVLALP